MWQSGACLVHWELLCLLQEEPDLYLQGNASLQSPATCDASSLTNPCYSDWDKPTSQARRFPDACHCNWIFHLQRTHASWICKLQTDWFLITDWLESESITRIFLQDWKSYSIICKVRIITKIKHIIAARSFLNYNMMKLCFVSVWGTEKQLSLQHFYLRFTVHRIWTPKLHCTSGTLPQDCVFGDYFFFLLLF